jgi:hypothetical protein
MHWTLLVKLKIAAVFVVTATLFAATGSWGIGRVDPRGPFVLSNLVNPAVACGLLACLFAATTVVGTVLIHRDLPGAGWLIAGAGWAGLALRSGPIDNGLVFLPTTCDLHSFYVRLLCEMGIYSAITVFIALAAESVATMALGRSRLTRDNDADDAELPKTGEKTARRQGRPGGRRTGDPDDLLALATHILGSGVIAVVAYVLLINNSPVDGHLPGPILRGQVLFALFVGFFAGTLATNWIFPSTNPWRLALSVPATGATCLLLTILMLVQPMFPYQPPLRISAMLPIDVLGMGLPAAMAGFIVSARLVEASHASKADAEEA